MDIRHSREPRFLDVFSYAIYRMLDHLRRSGMTVTVVWLTLLSLIFVLGLIAETRSKPKELPPMYNSLGIRISHSPFDAKFRRASIPGGGVRWNAVVAQARQIADPVQRLEMVHHFVTTYIEYVDDNRFYRVDDYWATPSETLNSRRGDCEDYAILEMMLLNAAGFARSDMYLTIGHDLIARRDHALLSIKIGNNLWALDQRAPKIFPASTVTDFRPIMTLSENNVWLHGYARQPTTRYAATQATATQAAAIRE